MLGESRVGVGERLGDAEVEHLDERTAVEPPRDEQVRRLEIAMDDACRVRLGERDACLHHVLDGGRHRQRLLRDRAREVRAVEDLHHHVRRVGLEPAHVEYATHVLGAQMHHRARLANEAIDDRRISGHLVAQQLDRDAVAELEVRRRHHDAHPAGAEDLIDPVPAADHGTYGHHHPSIRRPAWHDRSMRWLAIATLVAGCGRLDFALHADGGDGADAAVLGSPVLAIGAGGSTTCALRIDHSLWCWGGNSTAALGDGTMTDRPTAARVAIDEDVASFAVGWDAVCAITVSNAMWCWGSNPSMSLAPGPADLLTPTHIADGVTAVTAQDADVCDVIDGAIQCVGFFTVGDFGTDNIAVATGRRHACARKTDGSVWCAGDGFDGELGDGGLTITSTMPLQIPKVANAVDIIADNYWSCARLQDTTATCWGTGGDGTNPIGITLPESISPVALELAVGGGTGCARGATTTACWGSNANGMVGDGTTVPNTVAHPSAAATGLHAVSLGLDHACGLDDDQRAWCWGSNTAGQLGQPIVSNVAVLTPIAGLDATAISAYSTGQHVCAIVAGEVWCWGDNALAQLGNGTQIHGVSPTRVLGLTGTFDAVSAGSTHTCAHRTDNTVWCWGDNGVGALGDGTTMTRVQPVSPALANVARVIAGNRVSCAIELDQSVWCWGSNSFGQLGVGDMNPHPSPTLVTMTPTIDVALGNSHSCLVTTSNTVQCWGTNALGDFGNGGTTSSMAPVASMLAAPSDHVVVGDSHTCAHGLDGSVSCWGNGIDGELGIMTASSTTPLVALPAGSAQAIIALETGTCAIDLTGHVSCTGSTLGQFTSTFTALSQVGAVAELVSAGVTLCGRDSSGAVSCLGDNSTGTAGIGLAAFSVDRVPQLVGE